jgi:ferredoxin
MNKKIIVNKEKCIGCGTCIALAPEIFEIDNAGKSNIKKSSKINEETLKLAIDSCPTQAIKTEN